MVNPDHGDSNRLTGERAARCELYGGCLLVLGIVSTPTEDKLRNDLCASMSRARPWEPQGGTVVSTYETHSPACSEGLMHGKEHGDHLAGGRQNKIGHSKSGHASTSLGLSTVRAPQSARTAGTLPACDCHTHITVRCRTLPEPHRREHGDHGSVCHSGHRRRLADGVGVGDGPGMKAR